MRGLIPWLREALFGPPKPKPPKPQKCAIDGCTGHATEVCGSGCCAQHHWRYCMLGAARPTCHYAADGRVLVDLSFLEQKRR
jgi:hypothetical protein